MVLPSRFSLYRPFTQNFLVGCTLLCLPGIYTALTGLGAGGGQPSSADVANKTNALLYGLLALAALLGGPILNMLRPKLSLAIGSLGYPCYVGGLWYYDRTGNAWFALLAGAVLGITGGFLWTAAAYVQFSYAQEKHKPARYFNLRTRSVNNFAYQAAQAFVPAALVPVLDGKYIRSRRTRGLVAVAGVGTVAVGASAGLVGWLQVHRVDARRTPAGAEWPGLFVCYVLFGAVYAGYQMCVEYTLSATTNDLAVLARVAGVFKFYSALGMMVSFVMAGEGVSFLGQITLQLVLYALGICGIVWVLVFHVRDSNYFSEDNVIAPVAVEEQNRGLGAENSQHAGDVAAQNNSPVSGHRA